MEWLATQLTLMPGLIKAILVLPWAAILSVVEQHPPDTWPRYSRNLGLWMINTLLSPLIILPITLWACTHSPIDRPDFLRTGPGWIMDILILDFGLYLWHRLNHIWPFLWRFHKIHHLDQWLDTSSAVRFHFGEVLLSALFRCPIIVLTGMNAPSIILYEVMVLLASLFQHAHIHLPRHLEVLLSMIFVTPDWHHRHHHPDIVNTNSHYGTIFSFWDRLLRSDPASDWHRCDIYGLDQQPDMTLTELVMRPFRLRKNQYRLPKLGREK